jgi:dienelactone hydrolase
MNRRDAIKTLGLAGAGCLNRSSVCHSAERPGNAETPAPLPSDPAAAAHELFERYERRFAAARLRQPDFNPAHPADREAIAAAARKCLGIRADGIPDIAADTAREAKFDGFRVEWLRATSWRGTAASALLYIPEGEHRRRPLVVLCCGHGQGGKLFPGYQRMARHLARRGAMVLCPDNIGQGEREPMGHRRCVVPFACGLSVQGLIVMETLGWIAWAGRQPRVAPERLAAIGNSGGGTLTVFLAALCPQLAALSSSGYPSTFDFVARKEKTHCHCNLLPGVVGQLEMWHLLGSFAPRPLFIFQGSEDHLFPEDLFHHTSRKVQHVYRLLGAEKAFRSRVFPGGHSWDMPRYRPMGDFLAGPLDLGRPPAAENFDEPVLADTDRCWETWPADAIDTDGLARQLTGRRVDDRPSLADVFPPSDAPATLANIAPRGATRQILAQYELFLANTDENEITCKDC